MNVRVTKEFWVARASRVLVSASRPNNTKAPEAFAKQARRVCHSAWRRS